MPVTVTPIYAIALALLFVWLSARVIFARRSANVGLGDGENEDLTRRIRAQGNCAEYAPLGIILILTAELQGIGPIWLHAAGLLLLAGRVLHGIGMTFPYGRFKTRVPGMALTFSAFFMAVGLNVGGLF